MKKKSVILLFSGVIFLIISAVSLVVVGRIFIHHEQRQNADINQLQIESWNRNSFFNEKIKEYERLWQVTENSINSLFDSENLNAYQKIACGKDIHLLVIGDSIGALPWTNDLAEWIKENYQINCHTKNISLGGNDSYAGVISEKLLNDNIKYDLILLCYGQNDDIEYFAIDYEALIRETLNHNPGCCIISVVESSQREYTEKMRKIIQLAEYYGIEVADTISAFENSGYAYEKLTGDGIHPNDLGQEIYLNTTTDIISDQVEREYYRKIGTIESVFKDNTFLDQKSYYYDQTIIKTSLSNETEEYDRFAYYSVNEFIRKSENTWEIDLQNVSGKLGICRCRNQGDNKLEILFNDEILYSYEDYFKNQYTLFYIERVSDTITVYSGKLDIVFNTKENADCFSGIVFTDYLSN